MEAISALVQQLGFRSARFFLNWALSLMLSYPFNMFVIFGLVLALVLKVFSKTMAKNNLHKHMKLNAKQTQSEIRQLANQLKQIQQDIENIGVAFRAPPAATQQPKHLNQQKGGIKRKFVEMGGSGQREKVARVRQVMGAVLGELSELKPKSHV